MWFYRWLWMLQNYWLFWRKPKHRMCIRRARALILKLRTFKEDASILAYLKTINPYVFEELVVELFEQAGWPVRRSPSYSGDGGVDGKFYHPTLGVTYLQSKCYTHRISTKHVLDFRACIGSRYGVFVHTAKSSAAIRESLRSEDSKVFMLSGSKLVAALRHPSILHSYI
jgi:restriction system protein